MSPRTCPPPPTSTRHQSERQLICSPGHRCDPPMRSCRCPLRPRRAHGTLATYRCRWRGSGTSCTTSPRSRGRQPGGSTPKTPCKTHHAQSCRGCSSLTEQRLLEGRRPVHQTERLRLRPSCGTQHPDEAVRVKGREPRGRAGEGYEGEKGGLALRGKMLTVR